MKGKAARIFVLIVTSIVGMALLGAVAHIVATRGLGLWGDLTGGVVVSAIVGGVVGLFSLPFVASLLWGAQLRESIPRVYGISLVPTAAWAYIVPDDIGVTAAFPAFISVLIVSTWCLHRHPLQPRLGCCERCGYDLSGCTEPGCPECGWGRADASATES